ncbi:MAG: hypothetical protein KAH33_04690, partial [Candidatus Delongbacteria bacterium]|nr:hypothetical protein [Candidatus Delongbacteria bacterium]
MKKIAVLLFAFTLIFLVQAQTGEKIKSKEWKPLPLDDIEVIHPYNDSFFYCRFYDDVKNEESYMLKDDNKQFTKDWEKVDFFIKNKQPKSLNAKLDSILIKAEKKKSEIQILKAILYKNYAQEELKSENYNNRIELINKYLKKSSVPFKAVYNNMLFEILCKYYKFNNYKLRNNTKERVSEPIETWCSQDFFKNIVFYLHESIKDEEKLKKISPDEFGEVLLSIGGYSRELRPTLHDLII